MCYEADKEAERPCTQEEGQDEHRHEGHYPDDFRTVKLHPD